MRGPRQHDQLSIFRPGREEPFDVSVTRERSARASHLELRRQHRLISVNGSAAMSARRQPAIARCAAMAAAPRRARLDLRKNPVARSTSGGA
jgi:hypothetical protein